MKKFYASKTFWTNLAALPATGFLTLFLDTDTALQIGLALTTAANLVLRLFFTDTKVTL